MTRTTLKPKEKQPMFVSLRTWGRGKGSIPCIRQRGASWSWESSNAFFFIKECNNHRQKSHLLTIVGNQLIKLSYFIILLQGCSLPTIGSVCRSQELSYIPMPMACIKLKDSKREGKSMRLTSNMPHQLSLPRRQPGWLHRDGKAQAREKKAPTISQLLTQKCFRMKPASPQSLASVTCKVAGKNVITVFKSEHEFPLKEDESKTWSYRKRHFGKSLRNTCLQETHKW